MFQKEVSTLAGRMAWEGIPVGRGLKKSILGVLNGYHCYFEVVAKSKRLIQVQQDLLRKCNQCLATCTPSNSKSVNRPSPPSCIG